MTPPDDLAAIFEEVPEPTAGSGTGGNGHASIDEDDWEQRLKSAIAANPAAFETVSLADDLRHWAAFVITLPRVEQEIRLSERLAVMAPLHENAEAMLRAALAEAAESRHHQAAEQGPQIYTAPEFAELAPEHIDYLLYGYFARGMITQLAAGIKVGKTVFVMDAIRAILSGDTFLGHDTEHAPVLYLTEEGRQSFRRNLGQAGLLDKQDFHLLMRQQVHGMTWPAIGEYVQAVIDERKIGLVVVDTLSDWADLAPDAEKDEGAARRVVSVLRDWCNNGDCSVVALQHERKGGGSIGDSARGSTAFGGAMDILLVLHELAKERDRERYPNRRELGGRGRCDVPDPVIVEFIDRHYQLVGGVGQTSRLLNEKAVIDVLPYAISEEVDVEYIAEKSGIPRTTARRILDDLMKRKAVQHGNVPRSSGHGQRQVFWIGGYEDD